MFIILSLAMSLNSSLAQKPSKPFPESNLKSLYGLERLKALNYFTHYHSQNGFRKSLKYGKQAVALGEKLFSERHTQVKQKDEYHLLKAYVQYGMALYKKEDYFDAQDFLYKARSLSVRLDTSQFNSDISFHLDEINRLKSSGKIKEGLFSKTIGNIKIGKAINDVSGDLRIQAEIKLAKNQEEKKDFRGAIDHYKKSIDLLSNQGESKRITELNLKIAALLDSLDQPMEAQQHLAEAIEELESKPIIVDSTLYESSQPNANQHSSIPKITTREIQNERNDFKNLAEEFERKKDFKKSLEYFKLYESLSAKIVADSLRIELERKTRNTEIRILTQQKQLADKDVEVANMESERYVRHRNLILATSILLLFLALTALYHYMTKRRQHIKLTRAYKDLDHAKGELEQAETKIRNLLKQQVSGDIATELISHGDQSTGKRHFVCIMFLDIRGFTPIAEKLSPEDLIAYQNDIFGFMMDIIQAHHGNINQLLGDGFMATFGAPISHGNDCANAFNAAQEIITEVNKRNQNPTFQQTNIGIGLHAGDVVTGNVGNDIRKQYSVTGNPVIIASRIEQLNKTFKSNLIISQSVATNLPEDNMKDIKAEHEVVSVKGRSEKINILIIR